MLQYTIIWHLSLSSPPRPISVLRFSISEGLTQSHYMLISRSGVIMSTASFPEVMSQQILVGIILVGRLGVSYVIAVRFQHDVLLASVFTTTRTCKSNSNTITTNMHNKPTHEQVTHHILLIQSLGTSTQ